MDISKIHNYLTARARIENIPITWNSMGYTSDEFNSWATSSGFSGWTADRPAEEEVRIITQLLQAQPGDALLDVCCGYGRQSLLLAETYHLRISGVDISPGLISTAKRLAAEKGLKIDYEVRHGARLSCSDEFNYALIGYNSFSLFSPEDAPNVLRAIHRALRPGGRLFLDLDNKPYNCRYGTRDTHWYLWPGGLTLQEIYFYQDVSVEVSRDTIFKKESEEIEEFILFKHIYSPEDIRNLLEDCSYRVDPVYGDWDLSPLSETSPKMLVVAAKR